MSMTNKSEVAKLRERIALEYQAANSVSTDFTPTARHEFMIKRQEYIAAYVQELQQYMSSDAAMELIIQLGNQAQDTSASQGNTL